MMLRLTNRVGATVLLDMSTVVAALPIARGADAGLTRLIRRGTGPTERRWHVRESVDEIHRLMSVKAVK